MSFYFVLKEKVFVHVFLLLLLLTSLWNHYVKKKKVKALKPDLKHLFLHLFCVL